MRKILLAMFVFLFLTSDISAQCNSTQIDINTASLEELMKIKGLGGEGVIAGRVIDYRQTNIFNSLDELINVSGIGPSTLNKIKAQGLACVANEIINNPPPENTSSQTKEPAEENTTEIPAEEVRHSSDETVSYYGTENKNSPKTINLTPIKLNSQNIKTEKEDNKSYAIYGLIGFCILLSVLYLIKIKSRKNKNEFR